ncbi:hypothetical protein RQP46_006203 [Phenoliferia psychrophenolica]
MAPPQLPLELVTDIIEVAVELLIEEERHLEAHAPLSNEFLLSAALVSRTWHSIATPVLLKRGIVTSGSVVGFLAQIKAHGMEATLKSVRFGEASGGVTPERAPEEDKAFNFLVERLSGLTKIELKSEWGPLPRLSYPHLEHLATHLVAAHFLLALGIQPNLTTLEILPDPPAALSNPSNILNASAEIQLLELVEALPRLEKLKVPSCWASDALGKRCKAKGVGLLSG